MSNTAKNIFFLGKGGVGKSTSSALTALHLASKGHKVRLISMDPAHNQSDIFKTTFSDKFLKINNNLSVKEVDVGRWIDKYLKEMQEQVKRSYSYLTAFNLENYLGILKFSPGMEEYALLLAYREIRNSANEADYLVFDMPPTALTLKFFGLPNVSLTWLENLLTLRNKIIEKKEIIARVKLGKKEIETDKIRNKLYKQIEEYNSIKQVFKDTSKTSLNLVMNTDKLSFAESQLIVNNLAKFDVIISNVFLNKWDNDFNISEIEERYKECKLQVFPLSETPLLGVDTLNNYLKKLSGFIEI